MNLYRIALFAIAGLFLAVFFYNITDDGYFERWKKNPNVSQDDLDYYFSINDEESFENPPCDDSSPEFSFISNSPKNIVDCAQNIVWYPEGNYRSVYVIDGEGNYWGWFHESIMNLYMIFWLPVIGLGLGALVGAIIVDKTTKLPQDGNSKTG